MEKPQSSSDASSFYLDHGANLITITRIIGVFFIFMLTPFKTTLEQVLVIALYIMVAFTDLLDGWFARRFGRVTELGKILDPVADKILILIFLPLLEMGAITSFPVFIILAREFAVMVVRINAVKEGQDIAARLSGKIKTAYTFPLVGFLLARPVVPSSGLYSWARIPESAVLWVRTFPVWLWNLLIWTAVVLTVISFVDYFGSYIWHFLVRREGSEEKLKKKIKAIVPNTFTVLNFCCGMLAAFVAWSGYYNWAALLVILGVFFDAFDGPLARKLDVQSPFGARLDSQADLISFGLAPAVLIGRTCHDNFDVTGSTVSGIILAIAYILAVRYRLARFDKSGHTDYFAGLPSPVGAVLVLLAGVSVPLRHPGIFAMVILVSICLMISRIPYLHLGVVKRKKLYALLAVLTAIFSSLTIIKLAAPRLMERMYVVEILFGVIVLYVLSPLLERRRNDEP